MMKELLYLTHRVPYPLNKGDRIRNFQFIKNLSQSARVHLIALADEDIDQDAYEVLGQYCQSVDFYAIPRTRSMRAAWSLAKGYSASEGFFYQPQMIAKLEQLRMSKSFDAVIASSSALGPYLKMFKGLPTKIFVDYIDVDSQKWLDYAHSSNGPLSALYLLESRRVHMAEQETLSWCDGVFLVSDAEVQLLEAQTDQTLTRRGRSGATSAANEALLNKILCIRHAVDTEFFSPHSVVSSEDPFSTVFVGSLDYKPNYTGLHWFVDEVFEPLTRTYPDATLNIVGKSPHPSLSRLALKKGVNLIGPVRDVRPWLMRGQITVSPMKVARGVQTKVLESMACGRPTMVSSQSLAGISATPSRDLVVCDTPEEWQSQLEQLWLDGKKRAALAKHARAFVESRHEWGQCVKPLLAVTLEGLGVADCKERYRGI